MPRVQLEYHPLTVRQIQGSRDSAREDGIGHYARMFLDDVSAQVMPHRINTHESKPHRVTLSNPSLETSIRALFHIPFRDEPFHKSFDDLIRDFIRRAVGLVLARRGRAFFEIVAGTLVSSNGRMPVHVIVPIGGRVIRIGTQCYQWIPQGAEYGRARYVAVPNAKVWLLDVPSALGGKWDLIALSKGLAELDRAFFLSSQIVTRQQEFFGFDFDGFHSEIDSTILMLTRRWGWDARMHFSSRHALEYFQCYRILRFGYAMAILRNHVLAKMNALLSRLKYDAALSLSELAGPDEILDILKRVEQRKLAFDEAFNLIHP